MGPLGRRLTGIAGVGLLLGGPAVAWSVLPQAAPAARAAWMFGGAAFFALGWLLLGAALWPGGALRGVAVAAGLYVAVGLLWVFAFNVVLGAPPARLLRELATPEGLLFVLGWPLNVAQAIGLFGLGFN